MTVPTLTLNLIRQCFIASNAAYTFQDASQRQQQLAAGGFSEVSYIQGKNDARAVVADHVNGYRCFAVQGTQFTALEWPSIIENLKLWYNVDGNYTTVIDGYWQQTLDLMNLVEPYLQCIQPVIGTGHSMGGAIQHLTLGTPAAKLIGSRITFGAPMCGNRKFWDLYGQNINLTRIVNEHDIAPTYPDVVFPWLRAIQPEEYGSWWLHNQSLHYLEGADGRSGLELSIEAHMPSAYAASLGIPGIS